MHSFSLCVCVCVCVCVQHVSLPSQLDRARGQGVLSERHLLRTSHPAAVSGALGCLWTRGSAQSELVFVRPLGLRGTQHHKPMKHTALLSAHGVCSPGLLGCGLGRLPGCPEPQFPQGQPREQVLSEEASCSLQEELRWGRRVAATWLRTSSTGWTSSCQGSPGPGTALSLHGNNHIAMGSLSAGSRLELRVQGCIRQPYLGPWELPPGPAQRWPQRYSAWWVGAFLPVT